MKKKFSQRHLRSWAAGFIDGEGCFTIECRKYKTRKPPVWYAPQLSIHVRRDDSQAVDMLQLAFSSSGYRYERSPRKPSPKGSWSKPTVECHWRSRAHLKAVLSVLEKHPLLAKKSRDFAIWAKAVKIYLDRGKGVKAKQEILSQLRIDLQRVRKYKQRSSKEGKQQ